MTVGKAASQASHASLYAFLRAAKERQEAFNKDEMGIKICLKVPDEQALLDWQKKAKELNLPHFLVNDTGRNTHFKGVPTISALGIGPLYPHEAVMLKELKLYR